MSAGKLIAVVAELMGEPDSPSNPEYDRACVEIVMTYLGLPSDAKESVEEMLRVKQSWR